jgi:serine phosphatase RsbU (regulator of sigma subunit)
MATLVAALLDPATGRIEVAAAGHPPPLLLRRDGSSTWLDSTGRGTGYPHAGTDRVVVDHLAPGDTLLLYTDGLVEAHRDVVEGLDRLPEVARALRLRPAAVLAEQTAATMLRGAVRRDDTLVVAARRCR